MDKITHEVRLANWKPIIERCLDRPKGQTVKQWLELNDINEKQYYYWLRKVRQEVYAQTQTEQQLPAVSQSSSVAFAEIRLNGSTEQAQVQNPAVVIRTANACIQISHDTSPAMAAGIMKAVSHAL